MNKELSWFVGNVGIMVIGYGIVALLQSSNCPNDIYRFLFYAMPWIVLVSIIIWTIIVWKSI